MDENLKTMITDKGKYVSVYNYNGIDIWTLKEACPSRGDSFGYITTITGEREFNHIEDAIDAIDAIELKKTKRA